MRSETTGSATKADRATRAPRKLSEANINRREEILQATERVLRREGYSGLTARKVAAEAGFSLGHITYNFSGMDEVLSETYRRLSGRLREKSPADGETPLTRLESFIRAGFTPEFLEPDHLRLRIDFWSAALTSQVIADTEAGLYDHYRGDLTTLLEDVAGEDPARRARVPLLTDTLMAALDGLWLDWMRRRDAAGVQNGLEGCMVLIRTLLP